MAAGFIRSPEAVLDVSAYQEALPHPAAAAGAADTARQAGAPAAVKGAFMRGIVPFCCDALRLGRESGRSAATADTYGVGLKHCSSSVFVANRFCLRALFLELL